MSRQQSCPALARAGSATSTAAGPNAGSSHAVIFDVDGVLVDSYQAHRRAWQRVAAEYALPFDAERFAACFGRPGREMIGELWGHLAPAQVTELHRRKQALYREEAIGMLAVDGALELAEALHADGFDLAIASAGSRETVALALERLGHPSLFGVQVAAEDVSRGKPDPEIYVVAARRLGLAPDRCLAIEDSIAGVTAAAAAGLTVVALATGGNERPLRARADRVVRSLRDLSPREVRRLISAASTR